MTPSPPPVRSVLPSRLRVRPITPGFGFFGIGGLGLQRVCACPATATNRRTATATQLQVSELNLESRRHAVKRLAIDAENFRGAFAIVSSGFEHGKDVAPLDLIQVG